MSLLEPQKGLSHQRRLPLLSRATLLHCWPGKRTSCIPAYLLIPDGGGCADLLQPCRITCAALRQTEACLCLSTRMSAAGTISKLDCTVADAICHYPCLAQSCRHCLLFLVHHELCLSQFLSTCSAWLGCRSPQFLSRISPVELAIESRKSHTTVLQLAPPSLTAMWQTANTPLSYLENTVRKAARSAYPPGASDYFRALHTKLR